MHLISDQFYVSTFITNVLQKQCQCLVTAQDMILHLKEIFGEESRKESRSARQTSMKYLMSTQTTEGTLVQEHVLKMIYFINKLDMIGV